MAELIVTTPFQGALPLTVGALTLAEVDLGVLTSIAPYFGKTDSMAAMLKAEHDLPMPKSNRATGKVNNRCIWFGREMVLLAGPKPNTDLSRHAALTDQSDAWACATLTGVGAEDVLARLVPIDLRLSTFKTGHTARTLLGHMNVSITRIATNTFLILVFRSMAATFKHELEIAMESIAARS